jgi:hypothetical protein
MKFTRIITIGVVILLLGIATMAVSAYSVWNSYQQSTYWNRAAQSPTTTSQDPFAQSVDQLTHILDRQQANVAAKKTETADEFGLVGMALSLVGFTMSMTGAYLEDEHKKRLKQQGG